MEGKAQMTHDSEDEPMRGQPEMTNSAWNARVPRTVAALAKLEAEAEVMRKTIIDLEMTRTRFNATIRRLADENAMLKSQLSELGLRIYGTDTPECPDQVLGEPCGQDWMDAVINAPALATGPQGLPE
jgi:chromosome segregation ATPase